MKGYCCRARAWTSPDANRWTSLGDPIGLPGLRPTSVVATPSGFLVTAIKHTTEDVGTLRAWFVDDAGWNEIPTASLGIGTRRMDRVVATTRPDGAVLVLAGLGPIEPDAAGSPSGSESPSAAWRPAAWVVR
jgi:hypothetical protein